MLAELFFMAVLPTHSVEDVKAAQVAAQTLYQSHPHTFFGQAKYDEKFTLPLKRCPSCLTQREKIKWVSIVPPEIYGKHLTCWNQSICYSQGKSYKGKRCCREKDHYYRIMENDLHNLAPFSPLTLSWRSTPEKAPLSDADKGALARVYLYMNDTYHLKLSKKEIGLFKYWSQTYPPSNWEIEKNKRVAKIQGNNNPWIPNF